MNAPDPAARLLLVDDDQDSRSLMARALRAAGHQVVEADDGAEAVEFDLDAFDVVLVDLQMPRMGGAEVLRRVRQRSATTPVIVFTGFADAQDALELIAEGAWDYLQRPVDLARLRGLVADALAWRSTQRDAAQGRGEVKAREGHGLIGTSPAMVEVYRVIAHLAGSSAPAVFVGERGTGKELLARTLHARSGRGGPFTVVDCAALGEDALARELFGEPGRPGCLADATGATVLLRNAQAMSPRLQTQVQRALDEQAARRGGSTAEPRVLASVRVERGAAEPPPAVLGRHAVTVSVPALTARREDLPALIDHFVAHYASVLGRPTPRLSPDARQCLTAHAWPGNVGELSRAIEHATTHLRGDAVVRGDLPVGVGAPAPLQVVAGPASGDWPTLAAVERRYIDQVLHHTRGNKTRAAEVLGIDRRTLSRLFARERDALRAGAEGDDDHDDDETVAHA